MGHLRSELWHLGLVGDPGGSPVREGRVAWGASLREVSREDMLQRHRFRRILQAS